MKNADAVHRVEQVAGAIAEMVAGLAALRREAIENGFTREEAMDLVLQHQRVLLGIATRGEEE